MADTLDERLTRLRADNDLDLVAVVADGMIVSADYADGLDAESIGATAGDGFLMMSALGIELGRGAPSLLTIEYRDGTMLVGHLDHGAALVLLTGQAVNLGRLRIAVRQFRQQAAEDAAR